MTSIAKLVAAVTIVVLCLTKAIHSVPVDCDTSILPTTSPTSDQCGSLTYTEARTFVMGTIRPKLIRIRDNAITLFNHSSLDYVAETELTLTAWRMDPDHNTESNSDTTAASVHRMKCLVPSVVDVAANESILQLVYEEEPNFATEFQAILDDFCVLLELRYLVSRHRDISACIVSNNEECVSFEGLERGVLVKSIANELKQLASEVQTALGGQFGLSA